MIVDVTERTEKRKQFFGWEEHPHLSKLSELYYKERRDNYFIIDLLGGDITYEETVAYMLSYIDKLVRENLNNSSIDWENIYKYYQERYQEEISTRIPVTPESPYIQMMVRRRIEDISQVLVILEKYKDQFNESTFCLY